jgi:aerotaxis receptor
MRNNGPVTGQAFVLHDGTTLVSTTDLKSRITYCNAAFTQVSGYSREKLLGHPHNL